VRLQGFPDTAHLVAPEKPGGQERQPVVRVDFGLPGPAEQEVQPDDQQLKRDGDEEHRPE